jgi:RHS repeat-associated protein
LSSSGQAVAVPELILRADDDQRRPAVAGDGTGRYLLTWQDDRNGNWDVYASLYGSWVVDVSYTYDPLNRLIAADYSTGERYEYAYDAVGNRTAMTASHESRTTQYEYDTANRLTGVDGVTYTWDERGNLVSDGTFTYTYNTAGRMVLVESVTATLVYTYNADGLRVAQSVDGDVTNFAWDWASGTPEMLSDGDNLYLVGHDTLGYWNGSEWTYHLPDALGSIRQTTDGTGTVTGGREWTPFGVEVSAAQSGLGYTGEWFDGSAGFVYLRARWYAQSKGQFLNRDPWLGSRSHPQTLHKYIYVNNNPLNRIDPSGHQNIPPLDPLVQQAIDYYTSLGWEVVGDPSVIHANWNMADLVFTAEEGNRVLAVELKDVTGSVDLGTLGKSARYGDYGGSLARLARQSQRLYNSSASQLRLMSRTVCDASDAGTLENALFTSSKTTSVSASAQAQFDGVYRATQSGQIEIDKAIDDVAETAGFWATAWQALKGVMVKVGSTPLPPVILVPRNLFQNLPWLQVPTDA